MSLLLVFKPLATEDTTAITSEAVTNNVDDVKEVVLDDGTKKKHIDDATKIVSDNISVDRNITVDNKATRVITKSATEASSPPLGSDKLPAVVTSSKVHDDNGVLSQATSQENVQHPSQPDHLETAAKDKPTAKEAWQAPTTEDKECKLPSTVEDKGTVEDVNVKQAKEDLKVQDVEDEQQEIMEYVGVLEEEEKENKGEEEEEEER